MAKEIPTHLKTMHKEAEGLINLGIRTFVKSFPAESFEAVGAT